MNGYADLQEEAFQAFRKREYRRRRMLASIRGYLRTHTSPRWITAYCLAIAALPALIVTWGLHSLNFLPHFKAAPVGMLLSWPVFAAMMWHVSHRWALRIQTAGNLAEFKRLDDEASAEENQRRYGVRESDSRYASISNGVRSGMNQGGGAPLPFLIIAGLATCGVFLIWSLLKFGATLLAETILDAHLARLHPKWAEHMVFESWKKSFFLSTGVYFILLAIIVCLLIAVISVTPLTGWGHPR